MTREPLLEAVEDRVTRAGRAVVHGAHIQKARIMAPGGAAGAPNTTPAITIPTRSHTRSKMDPGEWVADAPPVPSAVTSLDSDIWVLGMTPKGSAPGGQPGTWSNKTALAHRSEGDSYDQAVPIGDLLHFRGPGGAVVTGKVEQVRDGRVVAIVPGERVMTVDFPLDAVRPHNPGGSAGAGTPSPLRKAGDTDLTPNEVIFVNKCLARYGNGARFDPEGDDQSLAVSALEKAAYAAPAVGEGCMKIKRKLRRP